MKKNLLSAVAIVVAAVASPVAAKGSQCASGPSCKPVPEERYRGGGYHPETVPTKACLDGRMFESIRLNNGRSAFVVGYMYRKGGIEEVTTVHNSPCTKKRNMPVGHWVIAFIDCDYYKGWVGAKIGRSGKVTMVPIKLNRDPNNPNG